MDVRKRSMDFPVSVFHFTLDMLELQIYYSAQRYMCSGNSNSSPHNGTSRMLPTEVSPLPNILK